MSNRFLVNPGTPQAWQIELKPGVNRIGRGEDNDCVINHPSISTHHCEITVTDTAVVLKDLGSTNGSFVERAPVTEFQIQNGQHVQFGAVDMMFESSAASAPAPIPTVIVRAEPPPARIPVPTAAGLRINRAAPEAPATPMAAPVAGFSPTATTAPVAGFRPGTAQSDDGERRSFGLSLTGVFLGAFLGMLAWHLIYRFTGWKIGIMALAIGCLAGVAPQIIGHYRSKMMGVIAALVTLAAIFTTQYLNARLQFDEFIGETQNEYYDEQVKYAKRAIQALPNETDEEIRNFLAKENSFEELKVKPEEIEAEDIRDLKEELPKLKDLASGKTTKEEFNKEFREGQEKLEETGFLRIYLLIRALGVFNIVNIVLGVGAAYMTAKGDR